MSAIRWLLAILRKLLWDNTLVRTSIRGLLFLFSALCRAMKKTPAEATGGSQNIRVIYPHTLDDIPANPDIIAASFVPSTLHPYLHSGPSASRSSQEIPTQPITQESYSLHSLSVQHLPATLSAQHPPAATLSVQNLPALPPSPNLGIGYLPSTNSSVVDVHFPGPETESPNQSRRSSAVFGDIALPSTPLLNEAHPRIFPGTPDSVRRYDRKTVVADEPTRFTIPPLTISMTPNAPPPGWTACMHPEGVRYFFHQEKRVFTDANLFDATLLEFINTNISVIYDFLRAHGVQLEPTVDLVVDEYLYSDQSRGCQYYFVNHEGRSVFWMDNADSDMFSIAAELNGITSASHIRHELEAQYWYHCELFPRSLEVTHAIVDELRDILLHSLGDLLTSQTSTVNWRADQLTAMITLADGFSKNVGKNIDKGFGGSSCLVGRLMHLLVRSRVYNFYGEAGARLDVDQSVYGVVHKPTFLMKLLSPLLFYAPNSHLVALHSIYTDRLIRQRGWSEFIKRLNSEWQEFTLLATVVLNANVAFLSIQSVDQGGIVDQGGFALADRTPTQISSYLSMLTSIGSIIIGLLLMKQHRNRDAEAAPDAARFLYNRTHPTLGLETLAVLYSLPYAMLIWSMVSFLAAFSFMCFENSSLITRTLVGVLWAAVAALILWCIFSAWESWEDGTWGWLSGLFSSANANGEEADGQSVAAENEAKSTGSGSKKNRKRRWTLQWPSLSFPLRKGSYDSDRTAV